MGRLCQSGRLYDVERWIAPGKFFEGIIGKRNTLLQIAVETGFHSLVELIAKRERSQVSIRLPKGAVAEVVSQIIDKTFP